MECPWGCIPIVGLVRQLDDNISSYEQLVSDIKENKIITIKRTNSGRLLESVEDSLSEESGGTKIPSTQLTKGANFNQILPEPQTSV